MASTSGIKCFAKGCRIVGCNKVCLASFPMPQSPRERGPFPYALGFVQVTFAPGDDRT
ncbi:Hypothetical predicted protein [Lynx pardinus]|uniref:Uncharacterized protein n=1 Tax=Lynx pardinus TaxID=191816 RepID=A0A485PTI7_LYNPA|nr:Hypothetical predicted protein [Lynx pardinus]